MQPNHFHEKSCLVTGGLGFIGSNLAHALVELGARVTLVDSLWPDYGGNLLNIEGIEEQVRVNVSDVRDEWGFRTLIQGQDFLFNLAGQTSHLDSMRDPFPDLDINCRAQLSILEACRKENPGVKIVFASTRQLYGRPQFLPVTELHPLAPVDVNGVNKMAGEWYHILYNNVYGLRACALRLTNTYGPRMRVKDARQTFLGAWFRAVLQDEPFEVWGGEQLRDYTFVDDCVSAMLLAASSDDANGQIYNLGGLRALSLLEMARIVVEQNGSGEFQIREFPAERKKIDIGDYFCDWSKIEKALGWTPKTREEEGVKQTLDWLRPRLNRYL